MKFSKRVFERDIYNYFPTCDGLYLHLLTMMAPSSQRCTHVLLHQVYVSTSTPRNRVAKEAQPSMKCPNVAYVHLPTKKGDQ